MVDLDSAKSYQGAQEIAREIAQLPTGVTSIESIERRSRVSTTWYDLSVSTSEWPYSSDYIGLTEISNIRVRCLKQLITNERLFMIMAYKNLSI